MKTMGAAEFKARCLKVMDVVRTRRESVVITKKGRPVARLTPVERPPEDIFGCLADRIEIVGDIESPVLSPKDWDALK